MRRNEGLHDGETEAGATAGAGASFVHAMKAVKEQRQMRRRNAFARVLDLKDDFAGFARNAQRDAVASRCVAQRVGHEVAEDLLDRERIGGPGQRVRRRDRENDFFLRREASETSMHGAGDGSGVARSEVQKFLPGVGRSQRQQVLG